MELPGKIFFDLNMRRTELKCFQGCSLVKVLEHLEKSALVVRQGLRSHTSWHIPTIGNCLEIGYTSLCSAVTPV